VQTDRAALHRKTPHIRRGIVYNIMRPALTGKQGLALGMHCFAAQKIITTRPAM
jgi:hypothetical protein